MPIANFPTSHLRIASFSDIYLVLTKSLMVIGLAPSHPILTLHKSIKEIKFQSEHRDFTKNSVRGSKKKVRFLVASFSYSPFLTALLTNTMISFMSFRSREVLGFVQKAYWRRSSAMMRANLWSRAASMRVF